MNARRSLLIVTVLAALLAGCSSSSSSSRPASFSPAQTVDGLRGDYLTPPTMEPDITLIDTAGDSYNVAQHADGRVTLVYFGYTHCPDICPTFMADVAQALRASSATVRSKVSVVFITVDPNRDTLPVLRRWLNNFNPSFVGLRGSIHKIIAIQRAADVPVSKVDPHSKHGYNVQHSAELLAFTPDREAHVLYTDGPTTISDLTHDLAILTANKDFPA